MQRTTIRFAPTDLGEEIEIEGSTWFTGAGDHLHEIEATGV